MAAVAGTGAGRADAWVSAALLVALFVFSWKSVGLTRFNALDTPLFLALGGFCLWHLLRFRLAVPRAMIVPYLLWLGWVLFSDFFSQRFAVAFARDAHWLVLPLFALICARLFREDPALVPLLRLAAAGSVLYIALYLVLFPSRSSNWLIEPVFGHVRHLSMAVGLLTIWLFDEDHPHRAGRALIAAGRFVGLVVLLWAGGRGALIALALALGAYCFLHKPARERLLRYLLEFALAFAASELISLGSARHGLLSGLLRSVTAESVDALSSSRMTIWGDTLARLRDGVWLYTGGGGNGYIRLGLAHGFIFHPHNVLLQILTDWGLVGLLALANFLRVALWPLRRLGFSSPAEALAVSILVFLSAMGMIDGGLYHLQFLICVGIAFGLLQSRLAEDPGKSVTLVLAPYLLLVPMILNHLRVF
jgi:hypothetical protein